MFTLSLPRERSLILGQKPLLMGVLNCTPDSFYAGSRVPGLQPAIDAGKRMLEAGATLLDVGGESSRPGSDYIDAAQEIERVVPVIEALRAVSSVPISIDTRKADVARAAVRAGADIINDISALRDDPALVAFAAERNLPVILMHMRGSPRTMQQNPWYDDAVVEVRDELGEFARRAQAAGIARDRILLDPGIGFGKRLQDNLAILRGIGELRGLGYPLVIGASRKSFIGALLQDEAGQPRPVERRLAGSVAVHLLAAQAGAEILRVHDVEETHDALRILQAVGRSGMAVS